MPPTQCNAAYDRIKSVTGCQTQADAPQPSRADAILSTLCGPIPPQWLMDALATAACDSCPQCREDLKPRCYATFGQQALAVGRTLRERMEDHE